MKAYTVVEVRGMVRLAIRSAGGQERLARQWRTTRSRFANFAAGVDGPGPTILKRLGLRRVILYVR